MNNNFEKGSGSALTKDDPNELERSLCHSILSYLIVLMYSVVDAKITCKGGSSLSFLRPVSSDSQSLDSALRVTLRPLVCLGNLGPWFMSRDFLSLHSSVFTQFRLMIFCNN